MPMTEESRMTRVGGHGASGASGRLWQIAVLTAAGAIVGASQAEAALYYWSDSDGGYSHPGPPVQQRRPKARNHQAKKTEVPEKESKPQGPLVISISIAKQHLRVYDANGFFAETPISTGMQGHPTPMGVFSVIQKHKLHHSNIYSGAPMPYMQRITWSGVAMHAGVLPGYPASHGCIRMPMGFAVKMWNWTKMGARVVVTPGDMTPANFSHPLLVTQKIVPQPTAANEPQTDAPPAAKADKAADASVAPKPATSVANLELRPSVGHSDSAKPVMDEPAASTPLRDQTHTADAGGGSATMSDAATSGGNAAPRDQASAATGNKAADAANVDVKKTDVKLDEAAKPEAEPAAAKSGETASSEDKAVETKSQEAATSDIKTAEIKSPASDKDATKADEAQAAVQASGDAAKPETSATGNVTGEIKIDDKKADAKADEIKPDEIKPEASKPDAAVKAATDNSPSISAKKDAARLLDGEKPAAAKPDPAAQATPKRSGQIAVFVSRKDSRLYVRQNFAPLFQVPITIAPSDRPLGTHVFTAQVDKDDANVLRWSVVSLPVPARYAERHDDDERLSRRRKIAGAVEMKPMPVPDSPAEALDRLTIPADTMARITEALTTGASIIVSDQGIAAGETGEGTDFIVSLR
jgi:lipoprotein-anchoring transpeptidase ErfK/SrfK